MISAASTEASRRPLHQRVCATPPAIDAIMHMHAKRGRLTLHHIDDAEGDVEARAVVRPLQAARTEICVGIVGGALFFVDRKRDAELAYPEYVVDVAPPASEEEREPRLVSRAVPRAGSDR